MPKPNATPKSFQVYEGKTSIKLIGLVVLIALFLIGLILIVGLKINKGLDKTGEEIGNLGVEQSGNGDKTTNNTAKILGSSQTIPTTIPVSVKKGEIAEGFPQDIPLYEKITIIESNSFKDTETKEIIESKIVFQSKKDLKKAKAYYEKWAKDNAWQSNTATVSGKVNNITDLSYTKDNTRSLNITIETLLYDTAKVVLEYKNINTQKTLKRLEEAFKNVKLEGLGGNK